MVNLRYRLSFHLGNTSRKQNTKLHLECNFIETL